MINKIGYDYIRGQIQKIRANKKGVVENKDIEYLHKVRVSSRKILSAIHLFRDYFKKDGFEIWEEMVLKLAKSLGEARDIDVHIEFLDQFLIDHPKESVRPGINRIKVRMQQQRKKYNEQIVSTLEDFLIATKTTPLEKVFNIKPAKRTNINDQISGLIEIKLSRIKMYEPYIFNINNVEELHELRKATKLLRYALEIFNPQYENGLLPYINEITNIQDKVGLIHDCDVWFEILPDFIEKEKIKTEKFYGDISPFHEIEAGILYFEKALRKTRVQMYNSFIKEWNALNASNFVPELLKVLRVEPQTSPEGEDEKLHDEGSSFLSM